MNEEKKKAKKRLTTIQPGGIQGMKKRNKLTSTTAERRERFCQAYATHGSATRAYEDAGYPASPSLRKSASEMLRRPAVAARIAEIRQETRQLLEAKRIEKLDGLVEMEVNRAMVVKFLVDVIQTPAGSVTQDSRLCQSIETSDKGWKLRMPDKMRAVEQLCKIMGYYEPEKMTLTAEGKILAAVARITGVESQE